MMKVWQPNAKEIENTDSWGTWSKETSEFPWSYDETETCYILEGEATVIDNRGNSIKFKAGDMVQFDQGLDCTWIIKQNIKKKYKFG
jgi:uncharacterized cupin superfamily protein